MTTYYVLKTNASNDIYVTDGKKAAVFNTNSKGVDETTGIDLYGENSIEELKAAYSAVDGLCNMDEIEMDFPEKIIDPIMLDKETTLTEIISVD